MGVFYVYTYTCPITNRVIYVGKGTKKRCYYHIENIKNHYNKEFGTYLKLLKLLNLKPIIQIVERFDKEEESYMAEIQLIAKHGRLDLLTGTLYNKTPGGNGCKYGWDDVYRQQRAAKYATNPRGYRFNCYDLDGNLLEENLSRFDLRNRQIPIHTIHRILLCAKQQALSAAGCLWTFNNEQLNTSYIKKSSNGIIYQFNKQSELVNWYYNAYHASKMTNIGEHGIRACIVGKQITAGGFLWSHTSTINIRKCKKSKAVLQYLNGVLVQRYSTITEAAKHNNIRIEEIVRVCRGKYKQAGGFYWEYQKD